MAKRALVIQHMNLDHPGRFLDWFAEDNIIPEFIRVFEGQSIPPLAPYDFMFVLGGVQNTWEEMKYPFLKAEKQAIREWVWTRARPYFGVCLGHQLLATALGGEVALAEKSEVGVCDVTLERGPITFGLLSEQKFIQWHHAEVKRPPQSALIVGSSPACSVQAMMIGSHAFSAQFHCEFTAQTVAGWRSDPKNMVELDRLLGFNGYQKLWNESFHLMPEMHRNTQRLWENFKRLSGLKT